VNPLVMPRAWCSDCTLEYRYYGHRLLILTPLLALYSSRAMGNQTFREGKRDIPRMFQRYFAFPQPGVYSPCVRVPSCLGRALHSGNCAKPRLRVGDQASCPPGVISAGSINVFIFEGTELLSPKPLSLPSPALVPQQRWTRAGITL